MGRLNQDALEKLKAGYYRHNCEWRGHILVKHPADLALYAAEIFRNKPDFLIETGTAYGGSALFFADMLDLFCPGGKVITVDVDASVVPVHKNVTYLQGSSIDPSIVSKIREMVSGKVMVVLDSCHRGRHVETEINAYSSMVTVGQFLVVEDCYRMRRRREQIVHWPSVPTKRFLERTKSFVREPVCKRFGAAAGSTREGWLKRIA